MTQESHPADRTLTSVQYQKGEQAKVMPAPKDMRCQNSHREIYTPHGE
jgi:hypothetical protein